MSLRSSGGTGSAPLYGKTAVEPQKGVALSSATPDTAPGASFASSAAAAALR